MIINNDPDYERKKVYEDRLNRSEDEQKDELLAELRKESVSIINLAFMYAKMFAQTGEDITKKWQTAVQQASIIQRMFSEGYRKGLNEGIAKGKEMERAEILERRGYLPQEEFLDIGHEITINTIRNIPQYHKKGSTKKKRKR